MTEPVQSLVDIVHFMAGGESRTIDHQHWQPQLASRHQLGRRALAAGVLTHDSVDTMALEQSQVAFRRERSPINSDGTVGKRQGTRGLVDKPQHIVMLRLRLERLKVLTADGQHDSLARARQRLNRRLDVGNLLPVVAFDRLPGRAGECQQVNAALCAGQDRVPAYLFGKGVGGVNQMCEALGAQKFRQTVRPAEPAGTNRYRLRLWRSDSACIAIQRRHTSISQGLGQYPCFRRTAKDQDFNHG